MRGPFDSTIECTDQGTIVRIIHEDDECNTEKQILLRVKETASPTRPVIVEIEDDCCRGKCVIGLAVGIMRWQGGNRKVAIVANSNYLRRKLEECGLTHIVHLSTNVEEAYRQLAA